MRKAIAEPGLRSGTGTVHKNAPVHDFYRQLDADINDCLGIDMGFTALIRPVAYPMAEDQVEGFRARFALIKRFQQQTLALFNASLKRECDPQIAEMVLGDVPPHLARAHHERLTERQHRTPVFFRTDEPVPGKLSEIQCPGSGWCLAEELLALYRNNAGVFGGTGCFEDSLAANFARTLQNHLGKPAMVHHLVDNASRPHGMRYFIQRTREQGVRYFSHDRDVGPQDCNFVRSHDFITLPHHNFFAERMARCEQGDLMFDLSPSALFDGKLILSWPFWSKTREWYDDAIRSLLPYSNVVQPDGFELSEGQRITSDEFCAMGRGKNDYYLKYAGTDIALNWGSKSVFLASKLSNVQRRALMDTLVQDSRRGRHWILQEGLQHREKVEALGQNGELFESTTYSKFSGFYGPEGLMGILVMQKPTRKVHGSEETIMSMVR